MAREILALLADRLPHRLQLLAPALAHFREFLLHLLALADRGVGALRDIADIPTEGGDVTGPGLVAFARFGQCLGLSLDALLGGREAMNDVDNIARRERLNLAVDVDHPRIRPLVVADALVLELLCLLLERVDTTGDLGELIVVDALALELRLPLLQVLEVGVDCLSHREVALQSATNIDDMLFETVDAIVLTRILLLQSLQAANNSRETLVTLLCYHCPLRRP